MSKTVQRKNGFTLMSKALKGNYGFTLIELLISITIIAIIASIGFVSYSQAQSTGRDSRRKQDLASLANALEIYYQIKKTHPPDASSYSTGSANCVSTILSGLPPNYINSVPEDPLFNSGAPASSTNVCYYYRKGTDESKYTLYAKIENSGQNTSACDATQLTGIPNYGYNYCISP
ncbi:prepilin-type N-terminal cleavage/methylation domain-containing protein [Candidatus Daviesbacteria bacterium]|nr:prepilin-type N-terminal cleavage/methylation domain-containing protein [Candidatus Daviesbacteria bacterium]